MGGSTEDRKIAWIAWNKVSSSEKVVGLDIGSLRASNLALLFKWWWRFLTEENSLWKNIICAIHGRNGKILFSNNKMAGSSVWVNTLNAAWDIERCNIDLTSFAKSKVEDGRTIHFWTDWWVGSDKLCNTFPTLFALESSPDCLLFQQLPGASEGSLVWNWRRSPRLVREFQDIINIESELLGCRVSSRRDRWSWNLKGSGCFSVKSLRRLLDSNLLCQQGRSTPWNKYVPSKVNILRWKAVKGRLPTSENLNKRGVDLHSLLCPVCDNIVETEDHMLVDCWLAKETWKLEPGFTMVGIRPSPAQWP